MLLEGIFAAIPTPFYPDERLYLRKLEFNVARLSRSALSGMVVLGSTGEAAMLTDSESVEVLRSAVAAATPEKVLIAGVGRESVRATVQLAEEAARAQYDAVLVRPPSSYPGLRNDAAVLQYFRCVADRSPLPVILYQVPKCAPPQISVAVATELAQHPNIIGIKDSLGDAARIQALVESTAAAPRKAVSVTPLFKAVTERMLAAHAASASDLVVLSGVEQEKPPTAEFKTRSKEIGFQVLCGSATMVLDALQAGATGGILAFASFAPEACQEVYYAWKDHDFKLATAKQERIAEANRRIVSELGLAGLKYACDFNGYYGGYPRLPFLPATADQKTEIEGLLAQIRN